MGLPMRSYFIFTECAIKVYPDYRNCLRFEDICIFAFPIKYSETKIIWKYRANRKKKIWESCFDLNC